MYKQKIRKLTIPLLLLTVFLLSGCNQLSGNSGTNEVQFACKNLEQVVRAKINKLSGPLYQSDVINIFELDAEKKEIFSLAGIEHLKNLRELDLDDNKISDLSPLAGLTKLKEMDLENNNISDLFPLANLINLEELDFEKNNVKDIYGAIPERVNGLIHVSGVRFFTRIKKIHISRQPRVSIVNDGLAADNQVPHPEFIQKRHELQGVRREVG